MTDDAHNLLDALRAFGASGPDHAIPQTRLARYVGLPVRRVQEDLALELLAAGVPLASSCTAPPGMFLARTAAELERYLNQLQSRCKGLFKRRRLVRQAHRKLQAAEAAEREPPADETGQLLFSTPFNMMHPEECRR